jgi:hypothetical protein
MQLTKSSAEKKISDMFMDDLPLVDFKIPHPVQISPDWFTRYKNLRREFMRSLTDSVDQLAFMNLSQDEFMALIMGTQMPKNTSLRLRIPLVWGGKLEISNMFLCKTFPHAHNMDRFIIDQAGADTIWLPAPVKKVYVPAHTASGGDGGNATEDRLAQMAAQMANRGME